MLYARKFSYFNLICLIIKYFTNSTLYCLASKSSRLNAFIRYLHLNLILCILLVTVLSDHHQMRLLVSVFIPRSLEKKKKMEFLVLKLYKAR